MSETHHAEDFKFVVASAQRVVAALENDVRLDPAAIRTGPGAAMVAYVRRLLSQVSDAVAERAQSVGDDLDIESGAQAVRLLTIFVSSDLARALAWLDDPPRISLELGARYFIQELGEIIVQRRADLILVPQVIYSTDTVPFLRSVIKLARSGVKVDVPRESEPIPIVLNYPEKEADSVLLHALFAHELGHRALRQQQFVHLLLAPHAADGHFPAGLAEAVREELPDAPDIEINAEVQAVHEMLEYWLEEMLCDTIATAVLGPAYVLSFATVVLAGTNGPGLQHPPASTRIALMLDQLTEVGWLRALAGGAMRPGAPRILAWLADVAKAEVASISPSRRFAIDIVLRSAPLARRLVHDYLTPFVPQDYIPSHELVVELIKARVLPCQLDAATTGRPGGAVDRRVILLAGWMYMLETLGDSPSSLSSALAEKQQSLQAFLTRALEMSRVLEEWTRKQ